MKKIILTIILGIFLISLVGAAQQTLGIFKQGDCMQLTQSHGNCTYNNISFVYQTNNATLYNISAKMTKVGTFYNYSFCNTSAIGEYIVNGFGDPDGERTSWIYNFKITPSGKESSTGESVLYFLFTLILFGLLVTMFYFIIVLPSGNEKNERDVATGIGKLKYLRIFLIAMAYPLTMILLNLMNGLAVNFTTLSIFSGTIGFLFEIMMRGAWVFTVIIFIWIIYLLIKDSNVRKNINKMGRFKING